MNRAGALLAVGLALGAFPVRVSSESSLGTGLDALRALDTRAASVSYALRKANAGVCRRVGPLFGWTLHNGGQYSQRVRREAQRRFRLIDGYPALLVVVAGGPAAMAGLEADDTILDVNGVAVGPGSLSEEASFASLSAAIDVLTAALQHPGRLRIQRSGETFETAITPQRGCAYETQVDPSPELKAAADASRVFISSSLVAFTADDDELAVILGHEYAHIILGHPPDPTAPQPNSARSTPRARTQDQEMAADRLGLRLAHRAGYDVRAGPVFLKRLGATRPWLRFLPTGHPSLDRRLRELRREAERLRSGQ